MNTRYRTARPLVLALAMLFVPPCIRKVQAEGGQNVPGVGTKGMSASEVRIHDSAFSLLLETYRQFQNNLIQIDYSNRLSAVASLTDIAVRKEVGALAAQERDQRLKRLAAQLIVFSATYARTWPGPAREVTAASNAGANIKAVTEQLRSFVVIAPAGDGRQDAGTFQTFPSSAVLLNDCYGP